MSEDTVTVTFNRAQLNDWLDKRNQEFVDKGAHMDAKRTSIARDPGNPYANAEAASLLLGLPSPKPRGDRAVNLPGLG